MPDFCYIYGLFSSKTHELRYVGITTGKLGARLKGHVRDTGRTHKTYWIKPEIRKGFVPYISAIQKFPLEGMTFKLLCDAEIYWIEYFKKNGCRLTNSTSGGEGVLGLPAEIRKKITDSITGEKNPWFGKQRSHEDRVKISRGRGCDAIKDQYGNVYQTMSEAARKLNVDVRHMSCVLARKRTNANGYIFRYVFEPNVSQEEILNSYHSGPFMDQYGNIYQSHREASDKLGVPKSGVCEVLKGKRKATLGYVFSYIGDQ
jgi:hypothetical protein